MGRKKRKGRSQGISSSNERTKDQAETSGALKKKRKKKDKAGVEEPTEPLDRKKRNKKVRERI